MKWLLRICVVLLMLGGSGWWYYQSLQTPSGPATFTGEGMTEQTTDSVERPPAVEVLGENLEVPWEILFLPDGEFLITERPGTVLLLRQGIEIPIEGVRHVGEGGLLGAALHPEYQTNGYVYLYQTTETTAGLQNRVDRYVLSSTNLVFDRTIVSGLPGARYHDGGRIAFGPDGYLYVTVGDALNEPAAQDPNDLAGSILRYTDEGAIPKTNPFDNAVYSYGHRNAQGLAWDGEGKLWSTEHGRSGMQSGFDELNVIERSGNYGWPNSEGDVVTDGTVGPIRHSGADVTWAPGGLAYLDGSLYIPGLRGATLYEAVVENGMIAEWYEHLVGEYGRLRTVQVGPDGFLYLLTSNRDGRGPVLSETDDRLLRVDPAQLTR